MDGIDLEYVSIGKWNSSIPSEICMNKDVFNEIFSTETWYKVLMPDQRERILHHLPQDVLETSGAAQQTMEDLLARTLNRFEGNPLDTFFTQLEQGRYDPNVVQTKRALYKAWKKDAIRKRKKYHVKLLQDIIVSRERLIQQKELTANKSNTPSSSSASSTSSMVSSSKATDGIYLNNQSVASQSPTSDPKAQVKSNIESLVDKRYREEIASINRQAGFFSSSEDESPPKKAAKLTKKSFTKSKAKVAKSSASSSNKMLKSVLSDVVIPEPPLNTTPLTTAAVPRPATSQQQINVKIPTTAATVPAPLRVNREEQTAAQMAKFPKILPAPIVTLALTPTPSVSTIPSSPLLASLTSPISNVPNHLSLTSSLPKTPPVTTSVTSASTPVQFQSNPAKSSPILASQLQSALPLSNSNHKSNLPSLTSSPTQKLPFKFPSIQNINIKIRNSSEDELESSSDDEFEAIEPTIGYLTVPQQPPNSKVTTNKVNSKPSTTASSRTLQHPPVSTVVKINDNIVKSKNVVSTPKGIITITSSVPSSQPSVSTVKYSTVQLSKLLQPQQPLTLGHTVIQQQPQQLQPQIQLTQQQQQPPVVQQKLNVVKLVTHTVPSTNQPLKNYSGKSTISNIASSSTSNISTTVNVNPSVQSLVQTSNAIRAPKSSPSVVNPMNVPKILPITVNLQQSTKSSPLRPIMSIGTPTTGNLTAGGVTLNGPVNSIISLSSSGVSAGATVPSSSMVTASNSSSASSASTSLQMFSLLSQPNVNVMDTLGDDLNLNLGLSINMSNLTVTGVGGGEDDVDLGETKFSKLPDMEKIDDLSVLEGNPFDSIPNLSDELDGLDLDLVDGLCDFEGLLSEEKQYASFFSLIRDVLCSTRDHRMTLVCLEKTIRKWSVSPTATLNTWFLRVNDWNEALITALNFLAGNYQDAHPEDFVPYIEYKYKTKYYQWIGAGRDSDNNLTSLCNMWLENFDRLPPLKKLEAENEDQEEEDDENEDSDGPGEEAKKKNKRPQTPPPPRCVTDWSVRPSTQVEKESFQAQERLRFENPHKAFTYQMHGYESVVGPVKGVYSSQSGMTNKARGHSLLVDDRPPYVTILALVRDAVARLPNGEGTRSEICEMLRDSAFLAPEASNVTLNSVVSGALDRLHYERDPCVRYDSHKKSWVYLHRDRTQEQFERLHHNRSYTKSTKSRSNTSRKSRKQSSKSISQSSSPGSTSVKEQTVNPAPVLTSGSVNPVSVATPTSIALSTTKLPPVGTLIAKTSLNSTNQPLLQFSNIRHIPPTPTNVEANRPKALPTPTTGKHSVVTATVTSTPEVVKQVFSVENSQLVSSTSQMMDRNTGTMRKMPLNEVLAAASSLGSTIRFTTIPNSPGIVAVSGTTGNVHLNTAGAEQTGSSIVFRTTGNANIGSALTSQTLAGNAGNLLGTQQTVALQVQAVSTSGSGGTIQQASVIPVKSPSVTVSQASSISNTTMNPGQLLLNSQAVLRLANSIRLPEGVRFAQVRLPVQQNAQQIGSSPVRLPQQRIILTRAALSGQTQTQGVLLGQTPSGQTVILSTTPGALGHLHGATSSQIPISITTSQGSATLESSNISITNASTSSNPPSHAVNPVSVSLNSGVTRPGTISVFTNSHTGSSTVVSNSNNIAELSSPSIVVNNSNVMSSAGTPTMIPISQAQSSSILQHMSSTHHQHIVTQVANQLQQQSSQATNNSTAAQLTSPIIIRSQQGDFVIPGHISLGRGVQGIKVIPVPAGKQTVLARIVTPNTPQQASQAGPNQQTANTQPP
ncbi:unnamed protein product [Allacma fusca]|uniref:DEUBAD domain-containing protein n=1 Tax=Allacma fusca TaxID=39272 RepID=A0A8J2LMY8_9HEXA|nr:unnamed protein product [Allacma fusca]